MAFDEEEKKKTTLHVLSLGFYDVLSDAVSD